METNNNTFQLTYTPALLNTLKTIAFWAKISAIISFVSAAVSVVGGLKDIATLIGGLVGIAITVAINIFLYKFSTCVKEGINNNDVYKISEGFSNLKTYYKIYGILLIIALSIMVLVFIFGIVVSIFAGSIK
jgi:hypothetical protein